MEHGTGLPFAPSDYKVWRNYKRVFECALLATNIENRLYVSDFGRLLASDNTIGVDEYLSLFFPRFRFPFPAFSTFSVQSKTIYPFCAVIKFLLSRTLMNSSFALNLNDVFAYVIGNECDGTESLQHYNSLKRTEGIPNGDEERQVREMLAFMSQMSIFKLHKREIYLDISPLEVINDKNFSSIITPKPISIQPDRNMDFINLTKLSLNEIKFIPLLLPQEYSGEEFFTEGKRVRITHTKIERSSLLRRLYFTKYPNSHCDMCDLNPPDRYPWVSALLEIHHVLPLSSGIAYDIKGTTFDDVVPLCPNCHRGVHSYYRNWLNTNIVNDFTNAAQAIDVYRQAKELIRL